MCHGHRSPPDSAQSRRSDGALRPYWVSARHARSADPQHRSRAYRVGVSDPTVVEEIESLRTRGYTADFSVTSDGRLRCDTCSHTHDPSDAAIESTARFEGASNPDDQAGVYGLRCDACRVRGVLVAAYGPTATAEEAAVVTALSPPRAGT